jgi:phospholipid/cholesterol/gamma-HCH transport system substrate-binding protein
LILITAQLNTVISEIQKDINSGKGPANSLLKDTMMVNKLNKSLNNLQKGTDGFNQNMEALKKSFLFRGYFKRQEKQIESSKRLP